MKWTKANIIKVLKARKEHALRMRKYAETDENKLMYLRESMAIDQCLWLLTDRDYFDEMVEIFADEIKALEEN